MVNPRLSLSITDELVHRFRDGLWSQLILDGSRKRTISSTDYQPIITLKPSSASISSVINFGIDEAYATFPGIIQPTSCILVIGQAMVYECIINKR